MYHVGLEGFIDPLADYHSALSMITTTTTTMMMMMAIIVVRCCCSGNKTIQVVVRLDSFGGYSTYLVFTCKHGLN